MSVATAGAYIAHRLAVAGALGGVRFDEAAVRQVVGASHGAPRLINILCHKAMMVAYGRGERHITRVHVERAIRDTESVTPPRRGPLAALRGWLSAPGLRPRPRALHGAGR